MSEETPDQERYQVTGHDYCADQVRRHDHDRFICTLFAKPHARAGLHALLAFNLELARIREAVSQPLLGQIRLKWWSEALDGVFAGKPPQHAIAGALADTVRRFDLPRDPFDTLIEARNLDMTDAAPADLATLIDYAEGTSAALFDLKLSILGVAAPAARAAARDVGVAWALTGLARAVPFHARARRIYLPADLNRDAGLDVFRLFDGRLSDPRVAESLAQVVTHVAESARSRLAAARARHRQVPKPALPALLPATMATRDLRRLRRAGYNPFKLASDQRGAGRLLAVAWNAARGRY